MNHRAFFPLIVLSTMMVSSTTAAEPTDGFVPKTSFFEEEIARFTRLAESGVPESQIGGAQGFYYLEHSRGEAVLLPLLVSEDPAVRVFVVKALGRCGGRASVAALIDRLADSDWEVRRNAQDALQQMTAAAPFADTDVDRDTARAWLNGSTWDAKEAALREQLASDDTAVAIRALTALRYVGSPASEEAVMAIGARLGRPGLRLLARALERIGTEKSIPGLTTACPIVPSAAWALTEIAGADAEPTLLAAMPRWRTARLDYLINLDRIGCAGCGPHVPELFQAFGLVMFRSRTDDLQFPPTAYQRVVANLILRTGQSQQLVDLIISECEDARDDEATPAHLRASLAAMRPELAPGFVRNDGLTVTQPLAALPHIIRDERFTPRLIALLDHPAFIVRVYAAESLAALKAPGAVAQIDRIVSAGYPFPDATTQVSGKHFDKSQIVRWRGFLCIAMGKFGTDEARVVLERLALDPASYRDIRYGSTVGLRFLASPKSLPTLERIVREETIRETRREAEAAIDKIRLAQQEAVRGSPDPAAGGP